MNFKGVLLLNLFNFEEEERLTILQQFGNIFFKLVIDDQMFLSSFHKSHSLLREVALNYSHQKQTLIKKNHDITIHDCEELSKLIESGNCFTRLEKLMDIISRADHLLNSEMKELTFFFVELEGFLKMSLLNKDQETKIIFWDFLHNISNAIQEKKDRYVNYLLNTREWKDCPGGVVEASPLEIYDGEQKLNLLMNIRIYDILLSAFDKEAIEPVDHWINVQKKIFSYECFIGRSGDVA